MTKATYASLSVFLYLSYPVSSMGQGNVFYCETAHSSPFSPLPGQQAVLKDNPMLWTAPVNPGIRKHMDSDGNYQFSCNFVDTLPFAIIHSPPFSIIFVAATGGAPGLRAEYKPRNH
jgi:hypothetical protein